MSNPLRGRNNELIGYLSEENGFHVLRDKNNNKLGAYNPRTDDTRDLHNRLLGKGNLLGTLLRG
jgi:hypothetical protein